MKAEARILVSTCSSIKSICVGAVVRGLGVDVIEVSKNCSSLCAALDKKGYLGELRYYWGECSCELLGITRPLPSVSVYKKFVDSIVRDLEELALLLSKC